jgi:tetratricopeptide (TPR) repeat protein
MRLYQRLLQRQPYDVQAYYRLGDAYIQKARVSGDVTYYDLAEQALRKALDLAPHYSQARRHLAQALYSRHAFHEAAAQAQQALQFNPTDPHAYGVLGDAYLETGQYPQAAAAYQKMQELQADFYAYSRLSGLKSLQGNVVGAIADLQHALRLGQALPAESVAWVHWQLGNEYFALGQLPPAEAAYRAALALHPTSHRGLAGVARVLAAQQQYAAAMEYYQQALALLPLPEYAAALGDVCIKSEQPEEAARYYALVEYIGRLSTLNNVLYNRELASFYSDHQRHLDAALALARNELAVRQDIYAYDLLAWVLYQHGQFSAALEAITTALQLGTQDARLFFHAGMIHARLENRELARVYLQRALSTNPYFHLLQADVARQTLRELEDPVAQAIP